MNRHVPWEMNFIARSIEHSFFLAILLMPITAFAGSAFDGTWRERQARASFDAPPVSFIINDAMMECATCVPAIKVKADGADQAVAGYESYDSIATRVIDDHSVELIHKLSGTLCLTEILNLSADGTKLILHSIDQHGPTPIKRDDYYERVGPSPFGSHAISGLWHRYDSKALSDNAGLISYKVTASGVSMTAGDGRRYDAIFAGPRVAMQGDVGKAEVSIRTIDATSFEESSYRNGQLMRVNTITVSADGAAINIRSENRVNGRSSTKVLDRL